MTIRIREDGSINFNGGVQIAVDQICHYFKCKEAELEAFLLQKLKEGVKGKKK